MAQLSSRKTLTRAGAVATVAGGGHYLAHRAFGNQRAFDSAGVLPAGVAVALAAGAATAFFETQDTS